MARRTTGRRTPRWSMPSIDWSRVRRGLPWAGWTAAVAAVVLAWVLGMPRLESYASSHQPEGRVEVEFLAAPEWVDASLASSLQDTMAACLGTDPLQRQDLVDARDALLATGWVSDVPQVRRADGLRVEVQAAFARPVAVIRNAADGRDHLVDAQGRVLPLVFDAGQSRFIAVVGARYNRPAVPGEPWPGDDVTAALHLLHELESRPWIGQVRQIDVTSYWRDATLQLVTDRECVILWGRAPGEEGGAEVPASQKLGYLDYHYQEYGHIDRGMRELDVTGDVVIGR